MRELFVPLSGLIWCVWGVLWIYLGRNVKRAKRKESLVSRALHILPTCVCLVLAYAPIFDFGNAGKHVLADTFIWNALGFALLVCGLAFAIRARLHLGRNWSAIVTLKEQHQLIRSGPYKLARHPIYTGLVLAYIGTAIISGKANALVAIAFFILTYIRKIKIEETFLRAEFGVHYTEFQLEVKSLIPFIY